MNHTYIIVDYLCPLLYTSPVYPVCRLVCVDRLGITCARGRRAEHAFVMMTRKRLEPARTFQCMYTLRHIYICASLPVRFSHYLTL